MIKGIKIHKDFYSSYVVSLSHIYITKKNKIQMIYENKYSGLDFFRRNAYQFSLSYITSQNIIR